MVFNLGQIASTRTEKRLPGGNSCSRLKMDGESVYRHVQASIGQRNIRAARWRSKHSINYIYRNLCSRGCFFSTLRMNCGTIAGENFTERCCNRRCSSTEMKGMSFEPNVCAAWRFLWFIVVAEVRHASQCWVHGKFHPSSNGRTRALKWKLWTKKYFAYIHIELERNEHPYYDNN